MPEIVISQNVTVSCPTCGADIKIVPTGDERIVCGCNVQKSLERKFQEEFTDE